MVEHFGADRVPPGELGRMIDRMSKVGVENCTHETRVTDFKPLPKCKHL